MQREKIKNEIWGFIDKMGCTIESENKAIKETDFDSTEVADLATSIQIKYKLHIPDYHLTKMSVKQIADYIYTHSPDFNGK